MQGERTEHCWHQELDPTCRKRGGGPKDTQAQATRPVCCRCHAFVDAHGTTTLSAPDTEPI